MNPLTRCAAPVLAAALTLGAAAMPAHAEPGVPVDLADAGSITIWGPDSTGAYAVPTSLQGKAVTAIAAAGNYTLALTGDGKVTAWGDTRYNSGREGTAVPAGLDHVTAIAAANDNALALKSDHTVVAWGLDTNGVTDIPSDIQGHVTKIAIGGGVAQTVAMALLDDGTVAEWGSSTYTSGAYAVPTGLADVVAIAPGGVESPFLALTADHHIVSWGAPTPPFTDVGQYEVPTDVQGQAVAIATSTTGNAGAITSDGQVHLWGYLANQASATPTCGAPAALADETAIDLQLGGNIALARTATGNLYAWDGCTDVSGPDMEAIPDSIQGHATAIAIADGGDHAVAITPSFGVAAEPLISGTPQVGQTLTLTDATFSGGQAPDVTTQWLADGAPISGATGTSLPVTADLAGKTITVTQTATLGTGDDAQTLTATSDPLVIPVPPSGGDAGNTNPGGTVTKSSASIGKLILKPKKLAKLKKLPLAKLKKTKAVITVTTTGHTPTGTVTITLKNKHKKKSVTATLSGGHATLKLKKLAKAATKGKNKLTLTYSGDTTTNPTTSHTKLKLK